MVQTAARMIIGAFRADCGAHVFEQILKKSQPLFLSGQVLQYDEVKNYLLDSSVWWTLNNFLIRNNLHLVRATGNESPHINGDVFPEADALPLAGIL